MLNVYASPCGRINFRFLRRAALALLAAPAVLASDWSPDFDRLFLEYEFQTTRLSPDGGYVAFEKGGELLGGNPQDGYRVLHRLGDGSEYGYWGWVDDSTLLIEIERTSGNTLYRAARLQKDAASGELSVQRRNHRVNGYVENLLPDVDGQVVFARYRTDKQGQQVDLFQFDVFEKTSKAFRKANRISSGKANLLQFVEDPILGFVSGYVYDRDEKKYAYWRADERGKWTQRWYFDTTFTFQPVATKDGGDTLLVITDLYSARPALVELDADTGSLLRTSVSNSYRDITWAESAADGYTTTDVWVSGMPVAERLPIAPPLKQALGSVDLGDAHRHVALIDYSRDFDVLLVRTIRPEHPGEIHRCVVSADRCDLIGSMAPWLDDEVPPVVTRLENLQEEAGQFTATLLRPPEAVARLPLVVMPFDIRAERYHPDRYDDGVRALINNGFAVLQLSYSAAGEEAETVDLDSWLVRASTRLDTQLKAFLDEHPVIDRNRVFLWGSGIDAFIALDFAIRYPDSVSLVSVFDGITDLSLMMADTQMRAVSSMQRLVASLLPVEGLTDRQLASSSVLYRHAALDASVYLSHSWVDDGIDPEHMWRLFQLLRQRGLAMEVIEEDEDQPVREYRDREINRYEPFLEFLKQRSEESANEYTARR